MDATSEVAGTVTVVHVEPGRFVRAGEELVVIESMKMEHPVTAPADATVSFVDVAPGDTVTAGQCIVRLVPGDADIQARTDDDSTAMADPQETAAPSTDRVDLARYRHRLAATRDESRPDAVAKRAALGRRTVRANIADLVDDGSFAEYGTFAVAAQRQRRSEEDLIARTPADGLVTGIATVNAGQFGPDAGRVAVLGYDYTVLAGTQGHNNHRKKDRLLQIAARLRLPVVLFAEGGGGRPGDTDSPTVAGLDTMAFAHFAALSGNVPTVGVATGYCFAGNAALLGCCDAIIATEDSNIAMAGPAMIEGAGLGTVHPRDIGPVAVQARNGVVDVVVPDDIAAVETARRYLAFFQGDVPAVSATDDNVLRTVIPERRTRVYDVCAVVEALADPGTVLELRAGFGVGMVTALARLEGRSVGILANNPSHLGGAIDADAADKAARFVQLCDAHGLPIVSLCDTPGFMVGPEAEKTAQVRRFSRMFVAAASSTVPWVTIVLRKAYGLGAQAMAGGSMHAKDLVVSWPTGEFGGMGLEGAVRLGWRKELDAVVDADERDQLEKRLVAAAYERGSALSVASVGEIDDVIDPADSRARIGAVLSAAPRTSWRDRRRRPMIDPW